MSISNLAVCYEGIQRCYRNVVVRHLRTRLTGALGAEAAARLRDHLKKEWDEIKQNAEAPRVAGYVAAPVSDDFDLLSVSHFYSLFEKFHLHLIDGSDAIARDAQRKALLSWMREIKAVRDPMCHPAEADLAYEDAFRTLDSARRVVQQLGYAAEASALRELADALADGKESANIASEGDADSDVRRRLPLEARLPSRETVVADFIGRREEIAQLDHWFADGARRRWMLTGDGGKGKSSLAYHFAELIQSRAPDGYYVVMWLSAKRRRFVEGDVEAIATPDFFDLGTALAKVADLFGYPEYGSLPTEEAKVRVLELFRVYPALVVIDDVDSLDESGEDAFDFFYATVTEQTHSKVLFTSRQTFKGFGAARTVVVGLLPLEARDFVLSRCRLLGLDEALFTDAVIKEVVAVTEGSPLYLEDLLRLSTVVSPIRSAVETWRERGGDKAREYALKREVESLGASARSILIAASFGRGAPSFLELGAITGFKEEEVTVALSELQRLFLMPHPRLVEGDERFVVNANTGSLVRQVYGGDDEFKRLERAYHACRGSYPAAASGVRTPYIRQATLLVRGDEHEKAEVILKQALTRLPEDPGFTAFLGWVYKSWKPQPRLTDARERFERAHQLRWNHPEMYTHWVEMEIDALEWSRAADAAYRGFKRCKDAHFAYLAGRANSMLGRELLQSMNSDKAKKHFETAQQQFEESIAAAPSDAVPRRLLRAVALNSDALGDADRVYRFFAFWNQRAPQDPQLATERARLSRKYPRL
jgi:tetratricopeptide (TPR) repeat protein